MRPTAVRIVEVGPRDGLQSEAVAVSPAVKLDLIRALIDAGLKTIEAGSFVSPKWVPQMAGTAEVMAALGHPPGVALPVLVPNMRGLEDALAAGVQEIEVFGAATESFSRRNINCSVDESLDRFRPVVAAALAEGLRVRGACSVVLGCPYEGEVATSAVLKVATALIEMGCYEVALGDTIGVATPLKARALVTALAQEIPVGMLAVHFHDTWGQGLVNIAACLEEGVSVIDSAVAGLGGCPYAKGASGNVATEDVVYMLNGMGIETGVDIDRLAAAGRAIVAALGRSELPSKAATAVQAARARAEAERQKATEAA